jgi:uncharacterized protein YndB with AHSA1/START domain
MMQRQPKWLRVLVFALVGVVALFLAVLAVGFAIPQGHVASSSILISATPSEVWALVSDVEGSSAWRTNVERVDRVVGAQGDVVYEEHNDFGVMRYRVEESVPPRRLVTRIVDVDEFGGTWTYEIEPEGGATRITITENGEIYSPLFRFFARFVFGYEGTMEQYLAFLEDAAGSTPE